MQKHGILEYLVLIAPHGLSGMEKMSTWAVAAKLLACRPLILEGSSRISMAFSQWILIIHDNPQYCGIVGSETPGPSWTTRAMIKVVKAQTPLIGVVTGHAMLPGVLLYFGLLKSNSFPQLIHLIKVIRLNSKGPQFSLSKSPQRPRFTLALALAFALALPFAFALASGCRNLEPPFAIPCSHKSQVLFWISGFAPFETIKFDYHTSCYVHCCCFCCCKWTEPFREEPDDDAGSLGTVYLGLNWGLLVGVPTSLIQQPFPMSNLLERLKD